MYPLTYKMETKEHIAMTEKLLGSIEAGGTKFVCGVGTDDLTIVERVSFPTTTPEETMKK